MPQKEPIAVYPFDLGLGQKREYRQPAEGTHAEAVERMEKMPGLFWQAQDVHAALVRALDTVERAERVESEPMARSVSAIRTAEKLRQATERAQEKHRMTTQQGEELVAKLHNVLSLIVNSPHVDELYKKWFGRSGYPRIEDAEAAAIQLIQPWRTDYQALVAGERLAESSQLFGVGKPPEDPTEREDWEVQRTAWKKFLLDLVALPGRHHSDPALRSYFSEALKQSDDPARAQRFMQDGLLPLTPLYSRRVQPAQTNERITDTDYIRLERMMKEGSVILEKWEEMKRVEAEAARAAEEAKRRAPERLSPDTWENGRELFKIELMPGEQIENKVHAGGVMTRFGSVGGLQVIHFNGLIHDHLRNAPLMWETIPGGTVNYHGAKEYFGRIIYQLHTRIENCSLSIDLDGPIEKMKTDAQGNIYIQYQGEFIVRRWEDDRWRVFGAVTANWTETDEESLQVDRDEEEGPPWRPFNLSVREDDEAFHVLLGQRKIYRSPLRPEVIQNQYAYAVVDGRHVYWMGNREPIYEDFNSETDKVHPMTQGVMIERRVGEKSEFWFYRQPGQVAAERETSYEELVKIFGKENVSEFFKTAHFETIEACQGVREAREGDWHIVEDQAGKTGQQIIDEQNILGFRPATHKELIAWRRAHPENQKVIVALGSFAMDGGDRCVAVLGSDSSRRIFDGSWFGNGWDSGCRFLFVRKAS